MNKTLQQQLRANADIDEMEGCTASVVAMERAAADRIDELERQLAESKLSEYDENCLNVGQYMQQACGELPDGYEIEICLESGAGTVYLLDKYSDRIELCGDQGSFASDILEAIQVAKEHAAEQAK